MVDPVSRTSSIARSSATMIGSTLAIGSDAYNAWIAARQDDITAGLRDRAEEEPGHPREEPSGEHHPEDRQQGTDSTTDEVPADLAAAELPPEDATLSGESERIGTVNFDEDTEFGERVAIL